MDLQQTWLLPALILVPIVAGLLCWLVEKKAAYMPRWIALAGMSITFVLSLVLYAKVDVNALNMLSTQNAGDVLPWMATFDLPWIPSFGISVALAMDGLSLLMIGLTAFLGIMAVGCSWDEIGHRVGFFHLNLLWSIGGVIGVFLAIDLFLFFFFWEMMLVPIYFLIALWGHDVKDSAGLVIKPKSVAAAKFFIYTQASGLIMLVGICMLVMINFAQTQTLSFHYEHLLGTSMGGFEYLIMLCFFIGFAVKLPVFPLHGWLPDAHAQAPTAGSVDLAGILIKTAAFGLLRFVLPLFPVASAQFAPIAIVLGVIGIFYGAFLAFAQTDIKRLLAYTSVSHMGFVVLAIYAGTLLSLQGLMVQMIAHGLSSAALFIMAGQLYERLHTRDLTVMGGMWGQFRYLAPLLMFFCAALLGIPGTGNFIGEIVILMGVFAHYPITTMLVAVSFVWAGLYALILIYQALFGENTVAQILDKFHHRSPKQAKHGVQSDQMTAFAHQVDKAETRHTHAQSVQPAQAYPLKDLGKRELSLLVILAIGLIYTGIYPKPVMNVSQTAMNYVASSYNHRPSAHPLEVWRRSSKGEVMQLETVSEDVIQQQMGMGDNLVRFEGEMSTQTPVQDHLDDSEQIAQPAVDTAEPMAERKGSEQ